MRIAILTFDGFNEIDSLLAAHLLNRVSVTGWKAEITCPSPRVTSMNGVVIEAQQPLSFANTADVVLVGSGKGTAEVVANAQLMGSLDLDPERQLIGSQCSGALVLAGLGLLDSVPVCTDHSTRVRVEAAGVQVLSQAFFAKGNLASAGGCLAAQCLAMWVIWRAQGRAAAERALRIVAPVGAEDSTVADVFSKVAPYMD